MQKRHKVAIARIFSDLLKADRIIDVGEMECWRSITERYGITKDVEVEAGKISLADAMNEICMNADDALVSDLLGDAVNMSVSDGFCAHAEALIMLSVFVMFNPRLKLKGSMISIPKAGFTIDMATALYIESSADEEINREIVENYRTLYKEFQLAGFHFVYLPSIIDHYRATAPDLFMRILSFLAPSIGEEGLRTVYSHLMKMTTAEFCKDLLCNKCGITELRSTRPAILIKTGTSYVGDVAYSNYLKLEVGEGIVDTVQRALDIFCDTLSGDIYVVNSSEEKDRQFHFHGFYKQLLDIFLIRRNIRSSILLDPYREEIVFPEVDARLSNLHRRERALYALLLCMGKEGLDFRRPSSKSELARYDTYLDEIQKRYALIYERFGGERESAPDLRNPDIRRPIFSCLKRSIAEIAPLLYNPADYNISKTKNGVYSVNVDPVLINVASLSSDNAEPLETSSLYTPFIKKLKK